MKIVKILVILALIYVGIVVTFESLIGYFQPQSEDTLVITTTDADGEKNSRVLTTLETDGNIYVAVNHWPRAWYRRAKENPAVEITRGGETGNYMAVLLDGAEHDRVQAENPIPFVGRFLMGFPPRYFFRLDPVTG